ncbi:hypothetical protein SOVF_162440 [Spinacia oleracea]|nr:receptor like protein 30-like [Spinacia oleracea]KNA08454.1 hypothetical protein SOVF_162440 [Spinacia oleracea]
MKNSLFLWLFWVCFIQLLFSINTHLASSICLDDQRSLLLQLRRNLDFSRSQSSKLLTWNDTLDCCQWHGVQCNSSEGHVIGLDLSGELITNSSDNLSSLFSLKFLQSLNLAHNSFNSIGISSGIGELTGLTYLNLSNAGFGGQVPIEISQLVKLVTLDLSSLSLLSSSQLKLENPNLAMVIQNFSDLRGLYLSGVDISANGSEWSKALSSSVPNLQFLSLSNCKLSGKIDKSLAKLKSLSEIRLDQNNLAASELDFIVNFRNLTTLKLSSCQLNGTFPQNILKLQTLTSLDLSYNGLLQGTLPEFSPNSSLQILVASFTNFSGQLPNSISNLKQLQRIELQNCSFSGSIPSSMEQLNQLVYVDFSSNKFSGLIPSFSSAKNLGNLLLRNNELNGTLASTNWVSLSKLSILDLSFNSLKGSIPESLFSSPSLLSVLLCQNDFKGPLSNLNVYSPIQTLDLSFNRLQGPLPKSVFSLQGLKVLKLSNNRFNGSVDLNLIQQLKNLSVLELSSNSLEVYAGTKSNLFPQLSSLRLASCKLSALPPFLETQSNIQYLDLSDNQIKDKIPRWIWKVGNESLSHLNLSWNSFNELEPRLADMPSLVVLDIHSNKLQGVVPQFPSRAIILDYSNNSFTSIIPPNIGDHLKYAAFFSLSRNKISGSIPKSLCNLAFLQVLDLSHNQLDGTIPNCLIYEATALAVLNVRGNNLSGSVPDTFPGGCILRTLDVNGNNLEGLIPRSLENCTSLEVLDLGNNQFRDIYPQWLKNLLRLRVLVLRSNRLHGSISCPSNDSIWRKLQIVDLAFNKFDGKLQANCFLKWMAMMVKGGAKKISFLKFRVFDTDTYYEDTVSVTFKDSEFQMLKILTIFTSIDFSSNNFHGEIPKEIGDLHSLTVLNLSHNSFSSSIPPSIGDLTSLESLDLSGNQLNGDIPQQFTQLTFLAFLNLSYNKLTGKIPTGNQLSTFDSSSFEGNQGLCGLPLIECSSIPERNSNTSSVPDGISRFDWQYILIGSGFGTGAALVITPLMFWKKGRKWYDKLLDKFISAILLACGIHYVTFEEEIPGLVEGIDHQLFDISSYREEETEEKEDYGQFCVFCSKLDIERKRVIHNPRCTCHGTTSFSSSFSISSSQ